MLVIDLENLAGEGGFWIRQRTDIVQTHADQFGRAQAKLAQRHERKLVPCAQRSCRIDEYAGVVGETVESENVVTCHNMAATRRLFEQAMRKNSVSEKISMDKSSADKAAVDDINNTLGVPITVRQVKYLNNIVEHDRRAVKSLTRPMLDLKSFRVAANVLPGVERMHMVRKDQFAIEGTASMSFADQFYAFAEQILQA